MRRRLILPLIAAIALAAVAGLGAGVALGHAATTTLAGAKYDYDRLAGFAQGAATNPLRLLASPAPVSTRVRGAVTPMRSATRISIATKSLPAPHQIEAAWGAGVYRHGGLMSSIELINYRHAFESGFENVNRFSRGTSARHIKQYVDVALRYGDVNGGTINYNVGRVIGTDAAGNPVTGIRVHVREGIIRTAFPVAP